MPTTNSTPPEIVWISRGRADCKGNAMTVPEANGLLRTTCGSCSLEYTMVDLDDEPVDRERRS